jgi:hypothetical protein
MKFTKMSLVAALLIGSSAFALENTKISGDANVYYSTSDAAATGGRDGAAKNGSLFDADNSAADIGLNLNITTDLFKNDMVAVSAGAGYTVLTTLGLENNLVGNVWGGAHTAELGNSSSFGHKVENTNWVNEAWVAATVAKSTVKVGRMELDTPLAFTEKWTIEKNTFEAAVLINQDIPDTTLVAAYVGNGNGTENFGGGNPANTVAGAKLTAGAIVNQDGQFTTYGSNGAYAIAAINNSFKPLTVQAWYYDVTRVATAYWLQADLDATELGAEGVMAGVQYTGLDINKDAIVNGAALGVAKNITSEAYAVMIGYTMKDMFTAKVSYSATGKDHSVGQNTATDFVGGTAQSKLYTEAWWNYGKITQADTSAINVTVESPVNGMFDLGVYYTMADQADKVGGVVANNDLSELTVTASKSFGPLDATVAYIYADIQNNAPLTENTSNTIQAYLTVNF